MVTMQIIPKTHQTSLHIFTVCGSYSFISKILEVPAKLVVKLPRLEFTDVAELLQESRQNQGRKEKKKTTHTQAEVTRQCKGRSLYSQLDTVFWHFRQCVCPKHVLARSACHRCWHIKKTLLSETGHVTCVAGRNTIPRSGSWQQATQRQSGRR